MFNNDNTLKHTSLLLTKIIKYNSTIVKFLNFRILGVSSPFDNEDNKFMIIDSIRS